LGRIKSFEEMSRCPHRSRPRRDAPARAPAWHVGKRAPRRPPPKPYLTRTIPPYELLSEEGLVAVERHADQLLDEIGLEIRGDLEAIRLWRAAGAHQRRVAGARAAGSGARNRAPIGTARIHPTRAQSREERPDRRKPHGVCPRLRPAGRVGPRRRAPLRHARGLPP